MMRYSLISMSYLLWMIYQMALQIYKKGVRWFTQLLRNYRYSINFLTIFFSVLYINKTKLLRIVNTRMFVFPSKPNHPPPPQPEPSPLNMRVNIFGLFWTTNLSKLLLKGKLMKIWKICIQYTVYTSRYIYIVLKNAQNVFRWLGLVLFKLMVMGLMNLTRCLF